MRWGPWTSEHKADGFRHDTGDTVSGLPDARQGAVPLSPRPTAGRPAWRSSRVPATLPGARRTCAQPSQRWGERGRRAAGR